MSATPTVHTILMDWKETSEVHEFMADLPGFNKKDISVVFKDDDFLVVKAERKMEKIDPKDKWHLMERETGKFERKIELPGIFMPPMLLASLDDGVLTLSFRKSKELQNQT